MTINEPSQMDPSLEIRKLSPRYVRELVQILEPNELWKRLMSLIPKRLERSSFVCDISLENQHKYHSEHFKLIENASHKYRKNCTEILLDEWGTSGRVRPALGHLLYLLTKAKLFRAAEYVAVDLLNQPKPERPNTGPEALITTELPEPSTKKDTEQEDIEKLLDEIDYPSSAMLIIRSNSDEAAKYHVAPTVIPQIVISPIVDDKNHHAPDFTLPLVVQAERTQQVERETVVSDMMKFSSNTISTNSEVQDNRPEISQLLNNESTSNLPNFELMNGSLSVIANENNSEQESNSTESNETSSEQISDSTESTEASPAFSMLLSNGTSQSNSEPNIPNISALSNPVQIDDLPNLSILNVSPKSDTSNESDANFVPDFGALQDSGVALPADNHIFTALLPDSSVLNPNKSLSVNISTHLLPMSTNTSHNSSDNSTKSRPCTSPLPNLSLNTLLPHFNYSELVSATNNFNTSPFVGTNNDGRFLGSGAFGSVFLALGLLDRPVAVKKLVLEDVEVVNVHDTVTKQFRNEVEVLSKYKHENLLSLLGYSCDGCTYCLMYEYIPGGALKDRLQATEGKLQWKERLNVAIGTARAVSYLHTAFSMPLIHRDIKSANILLDSKNKPKLCDFGLIKLASNQNTNPATTAFGTSAYMSPEGFRGDVSVKLDTFSFGVVLLELLTSLPPIDENREGSDLVTHVDDNCENEDVTPLLDKGIGSWQQDDTNFADELFKIARKCLEENKKKRPSMVEVTIFLEELLNKLHE